MRVCSKLDVERTLRDEMRFCTLYQAYILDDTFDCHEVLCSKKVLVANRGYVEWKKLARKNLELDEKMKAKLRYICRKVTRRKYTIH